MSTSLHLLTKTRFSTESRYLLESTSKRGLSNFSQYSAEMSHAVADAIVFSKSFARRLFRLSHARLRSTPESGSRAGYDGAKRKKGSKLHMAVDTLGHLLALHVTLANRAIPDQKQRKPLKSTILPSKLSGGLRQNGVLCCCPDDGSWKDHSRGQHGAEGS